MSDAAEAPGWRLSLEGLQRGTIRGTLRHDDATAAPPEIDVCVDGVVIGAADLSHDGEGFLLTATLTPDAISDGVTTILFRVRGKQAILGTYPIRAGAALDADVVTDVATLRAELDALKAAFMEDAHDTKLRAVERDLIIAEAVEAAMSTVSRG